MYALYIRRKCELRRPPFLRAPPVRSAGDHALANEETAIGPGIADLDDGEGLFGRRVEIKAFDTGHRQGPAGDPVDLGLHLALNFGNRSGIADHLHAPDRIGFEIVDRQ